MRPRDWPHRRLEATLVSAMPIAAADFKIAVFRNPPGDAGAMGARAEILDGQGVEPAHRLFLQFEPHRSHDLVAEHAAGRIADRIFGGLKPAHDADDLAKADAPPLAGEPIAAARTADADKNAVPHQLLQHRLE